MIYTVTFNPAVDLVIRSGGINMGAVNRLDSQEVFFGGKGINVSLVLRELGVPSVALGFVAGFTGDAIEKYLSGAGIENDFIHLENGLSRINVKIKEKTETELNAPGPDIPEKDAARLLEKLDDLRAGDTLVLAGSIPSSMPDDIYEKIMKRLERRGIRTAVDASGELLLNVLKYSPFLVKPNNFELEELFGVKLENISDVITYAHKLQEMGAENVLVSMAENGAVLLDGEGNVHISAACKGKAVNSVGAGDSMLAGFLAGCDSDDFEYALRLGTASGGATAFSPGLAKKDEIFELLSQLEAGDII
ncbi:MAG: 1-phosphofructokinase [Alistipes sp.]|nr:1-phosphofructokinase [Alistipes sp.]